MRASRLPSARVLVPLLGVVALSSCAYYNTFYLARRYYDRATVGAPYPVEKPDPSAVANFNRSIEYSKKLLAGYPKSKWVDDAYLLWARSLIGKDDPIQTMNMLRDFSTRYPQSSLKNEALFYLGVGGRKARAYTEALAALDEFLKRAPDHELAPYALLERARVLMALERPGEAAASASQVLERFPKSRERDHALVARADARLAQGDHEQARADYHLLGMRAQTDNERFDYLLKEADCLEAARRYDDELNLLQAALGHEQEPQPPTTAGVNPTGFGVNQPSVERWGRLMIRMGSAHALAGRKDQALESYRRVIEGYPRTNLAAEAQYRVGYAYETLADDFENARLEYAKVQSHSPASQFTAQAGQRVATLERLSQYRSGAGPDSVGKKAEAGFLLAEQYLLQLDKPDRALEEYRKVADDFAGTPYAGKALNAEAWVLRNKLQQSAAADSVLWVVVRNYPKTEAQVDARDYLERYGHQVPEGLIQRPDPPAPVARDTVVLTRPPARTDSIGVRRVPAALDSLLRYGVIRAGENPAGPTRAPLPRDSVVARDSVRTVPFPDSAAVRDSTRRGFVPALPESLAKQP